MARRKDTVVTLHSELAWLCSLILLLVTFVTIYHPLLQINVIQIHHCPAALNGHYFV